MRAFEDVRFTQLDRAKKLERIMIDAATEGWSEDEFYGKLRLHFIQSEELAPFVPSFLRECRTLNLLRSWTQGQSGQWQPRRVIIQQGFTALIDYLERGSRSPGDETLSSALETFDTDGVHAIWSKALARRATDPEGAITVARTLLEAVCKRICDENHNVYGEKDDLPKLYNMAAASLNLAPSQHAEEPIKMILGG